MSKYTEKELKDASEMTAKLKKTPAKESFSKSIADVVTFLKFLVKASFAVAIMYCGGYAIYKGINSTYLLSHYALIVAGVAAFVQGLTLLYGAVMKVSK